MSGKLFQKKTIGVASIDIDSKAHTGLALSGKFVATLLQTSPASQIYAICIAHLIYDLLAKIETLVICNDEPFDKVLSFLNAIFKDNIDWNRIEKLSIGDLRKKLGDSRISSLADNAANAYRKRALKPRQHHIGIPLNVRILTHSTFKEYRKKCE